MDTGDEVLQKLHAVVRSAKAVMLLLSLKRSPDLLRLKLESVNSETQEKEMEMMKEIEALRLGITIERRKRRQAKLCGLLLLATQVALLLSLWSLILVIAYFFS